MKVLMVSGVYTHPHDMGNRQRAYRECYEMKKLGWEVDFLYWGTRLSSHIDKMVEFFGKDHFYLVNITDVDVKYQIKSFLRSKLNIKNISKVISLKYSADEMYYNEVSEMINILCNKNQYDVIWMQYLTQSKAFENIDKNPYKIIDTIDKFANRNKMFQNKFRIPEGFYTTIRGERKALSRADMVIAIQDRESEYFSKLLRNNSTYVKVLGDMVNINKTQICNSKKYGFIGAKNDANFLGINWFIKNVLPSVIKLEPNSKFVIAGGICELIPNSTYYIKLGYMRDLEEFYNQIMFAINPIQNGTGLNIKSIEALSYMKPLITTSIGAKGLGEHNKALEICDKANLFAKSVAKLLNDNEKCKNMRQEAEKFIWNYNRQNIDMLLEIENTVKERRGKMV